MNSVEFAESPFATIDHFKMQRHERVEKHLGRRRVMKGKKNAKRVRHEERC